MRPEEGHWTAAAISEALSASLQKALALMLKAKRQDAYGRLLEGRFSALS
jgi:hypothetical protein